MIIIDKKSKSLLGFELQCYNGWTCFGGCDNCLLLRAVQFMLFGGGNLGFVWLHDSKHVFCDVFRLVPGRMGRICCESFLSVSVDFSHDGSRNIRGLGNNFHTLHRISQCFCECCYDKSRRGEREVSGIKRDAYFIKSFNYIKLISKKL
jgi:hypothetical protein